METSMPPLVAVIRTGSGQWGSAPPPQSKAAPGHKRPSQSCAASGQRNRRYRALKTPMLPVPTSPFSHCLSANLFTACQGPRFWHRRALARELFALCSLCVLCALWRCSAHNNSSPSISQKHQHSSGPSGSY